MADNVTHSAAITIHQVVHGYSEGHRELASSLRLNARDTRVISILSDVSSSGLRFPDTGYLTGYPLFDAGFYVLARTWPAPEVSRPGAVWTHSLLIEFADLAAIQDMRSLLPLLQRPTTDTPAWEQTYRHPIVLDAADNPPRSANHRPNARQTGLSLSMEDWLASVLAALYEKPMERIVATVPAKLSADAENAVLALWSQQWPRLRRSFRFCTATTSDRQIERIAFDLQLSPDPERGSRSRFPGAVFIGDDVQVSASDWLSHALIDLRYPDSSNLRKFLITAGSSAAKGRGAFISLVRVHEILTGNTVTAEGATQALNVVNNELDGPSNLVLELLVHVCARNIENMTQEIQEYVLSHIALLTDTDFASLAPRIGLTIWHRSKFLFLDLTRGTGRPYQVAKAAIRELLPKEILSGLDEVSALTAFTVHERPQLLEDADLWASSDAVVTAALLAVSGFSGYPSAVFRSLISVDSPRLRELARNAFGTEVLWRAVADAANAHPHEPSDPLARWIQALCSDTNSLASVLASGTLRWQTTLHAIALLVGPDAVPNAFGDDPWLIALGQASGNLDDGARLFFSSYLFARALGPSSRNCAGLIEASFDDVYNSAAQNAMPLPAWLLLSPRLPQPGYWQSWDHCKQLCYAVAQLYVGGGLSPASFAKLGRSDDVFRKLVKAAAKEWHGRRYLRDVLLELERGGSFTRRQTVDEQLSSWL